MRGLEEGLKKLGYVKWDSKSKPSIQTEFIHCWYKKKGRWKMEHYIRENEYKEK